MSLSAHDLIPDELFDRILGRAAHHDQTNTFPHDDWSELSAAGYLRMMVPKELGGLGCSLEVAVEAQARLAQAAPATALAVNMHLIWTAVATVLRSQGDNSLEFVLRDAAAGEFFAFGVSEPGNDLVLFDSLTEAVTSADGSVAFTGTKIFTSGSPVWTRLGVFGLDRAGAEPTLVHGFVSRDDPGVSSLDDWDTIGMRGSQSHTTVLRAAVAPADRVHGRRPVGPSGHPLVFAIFACFELLVSAVYVGIAERSAHLAIAAVRHKRSRRTGMRGDQNPDTRWKIADITLALDALWPPLRALAADVDRGVDHGDQWFRYLTGVKLRSTAGARDIVGRAVAVAGGAAFFSSHELGRLYRDVLAGGFHPSNDDSVHHTVASAVLGPLGEPS